MTLHPLKPVTVKTHHDGEQVLYLDEGEVLCAACKGAGRWDSCFDCGNRGYTFAKGYSK